MVVTIYGQQITATNVLKYLGVTLDATCSSATHASQRTASFKKTLGMLLTGLGRIPAFTLEFAWYLYGASVQPTVTYGMELFSWTDGQGRQIFAQELLAWRRLLRVGARSLVDAAHTLAQQDDVVTIWRVQRVGFLFRLSKSPVDSWQHTALALNVLWRTEWFKDTLQDLQILLPTILISVVAGPRGPMVSSSSYFDEEGGWRSLHPRQLAPDWLGRRYRWRNHPRDDLESRAAIKKHVSAVTGSLKARILRGLRSQLVEQLLARQAGDANSKTAF